MTTNDDTGVSRETLEGTPVRALQFLRAVGTSLPIRAALMARGYATADHQEGWALLHATSGFVEQAEELEDAEVRNAIQLLDAWDEDGLRIVRAALRRRHPVVAAFLLAGLAPGQGVQSVLVIATLLERLGQLRSGDARADSRADDQAALALLASRGFDEAEWTRLAKLVATAQSASAIPAPARDPAASERAHLAALVQLRGWYEEWSDVARSVIKRRDHLIRLGLAKRRVARPGEPQELSGADAAD